MSTQYMNEPATKGKVVIETTVGPIEIELWSTECPLACRNFVQLCMEGYYNGSIFHRLVKDFIVQGGDPTGTGNGGESIYGKPFKDEFHQRLQFNRRALLGMANAGKDDNGSQFFFTLGTEKHAHRFLDKKHTLFGKVVGPTVFNMLRLAECDTDENERPLTVNKITGSKVLSNPFEDIKPRIKKKEKKKKKEKESKPVVKRQLNLLSFGDEAEEDDGELDQINQKLQVKGKSAHDVLDDEKLSKELAVEKISHAEDSDEDNEYERDTKSTVSGVRDRLLAKKRKMDEFDDNAPDMDFEEMIENEEKLKEKAKLEAIAAELKGVQKEYVKAVRGPKEKKEANDDDLPEALRKHNKLKQSFKDKSKHVLKQKDPERENQTMNFLLRFKNRLAASNQNAILFDKKVKLEDEEEKRMETDEKKRGEEKEEEEKEKKQEKTFGLDLDAEDDTQGVDWMKHKFVAEDEESKVSKAKDANTKDTNEDWYDITDPRNPLNKRRRGEV